MNLLQRIKQVTEQTRQRIRCTRIPSARSVRFSCAAACVFLVLGLTTGFSAVDQGGSVWAGFTSQLFCAPPADSSIEEYTLKAVFIYNFAKFTKWPGSAFEGPKSPIVIGIYGKDPFGSILDKTVQGRTINKRKIEVKRLKELKTLKECHILFICQSEKNRVGMILKRVENTPVLTMSDIADFRNKGGIVYLLMKRRKIRFEINFKQLHRTKLIISSKLLSLALNKPSK